MRNVRALALALSTAASPFVAQAAPTVFQFTAAVRESLMSDVAAGDLITGQFTYDPTAAPEASSSSNRATYSFNDPRWGVFEAQVGNHHFSASHLSVLIRDNFGANFEDVVSINAGYELKMDGVVLPNGSMSLFLASKHGRTGVLTSTALPRDYSMFRLGSDDFATGGGAQIDGGPGQQLFTLTPLSITSVPEAGSVQMAVAGLLGVGASLRMRRRQRRA